MDRPLRILHLTLGADAGGLSKYIVDIGTAMHAQGHEIVVAGDTGAWQWAFDRSPLKFIQIPLKGGLLSFRKSVRILGDYLREHPVDLLHTHYRRATLLARRLQRHRSPRIVYTLHLSHLSLAFPRNLFSDFGDVTHVASEDAQRWVIDEAHVKPENVSLIHHGVDVHRYTLTTPDQRAAARRELGLSDDDRVALYVGRLDYPKNEEWLLDLAEATRGSIPNLKVILVGEGPHEIMLRQRIGHENLSDRVRLTGHQDPLSYYRAADAILLPSIREGFSLVCAEAMATGIPALRTRTSGTHELIREGITGRSTPIDHDAFLATAIEFLRDPESLRRMGFAASNLVRENFTFDQQLSRTLDLYRSMITI
jgi:glycosyltransferase involved in cell wall biosynthesis